MTASREPSQYEREFEFQHIPVAAITIPENVRTATDPEKDAELLASVQAHGIIEPLIVQGSPVLNGLQLVAGFRRLQAARAAGLETVPCRVMGIDHQKVHEFRLIENLQREDLNPLDEARAYREYFKNYPDVTQEELGRRLGKSQSYIANRLRLLGLPEKGQELITSGILSASAAQEVLKVQPFPKVFERATNRLASDAAPAEVPGEDQPAPAALTVERVRRVVDEAVNDATKDLSSYACEFDVKAECEGCKKRVVARWGTRCGDPACWTGKQKAARTARREAATAKVLSGRVIDWREADLLAHAFNTCPAKCEHKKKASLGGDVNSRAFCLAPDSDCYRERKKADKLPSWKEQNAKYEAERKRQDAARPLWRAREDDRQKSVETYLKTREISAAPPADELTLICLRLLPYLWAPAEAEKLAGSALPKLIAVTVKHLLTEETNATWDAEAERWVPRAPAYEAVRSRVIGWTPPAEEEAPAPDPSEGGVYRVDDDGQAVDPVEDAVGEAAAEASDEEMAEADKGPCSGECATCPNTRCDMNDGYVPTDAELAAMAKAADAGPAEPPADDPEEEPEPAACHYLRRIVDARECRSCNDELRMSGQCCDYVLRGEAPHKCPTCDEFSGCQKGQQAFPDEARALEAAG